MAHPTPSPFCQAQHGTARGVQRAPQTEREKTRGASTPESSLPPDPSSWEDDPSGPAGIRGWGWGTQNWISALCRDGAREQCGHQCALSLRERLRGFRMWPVAREDKAGHAWLHTHNTHHAAAQSEKAFCKPRTNGRARLQAAIQKLPSAVSLQKRIVRIQPGLQNAFSPPSKKKRTLICEIEASKTGGGNDEHTRAGRPKFNW